MKLSYQNGIILARKGGVVKNLKAVGGNEQNLKLMSLVVSLL